MDTDTEIVLADNLPKAMALHTALVEQVAEGKPPTLYFMGGTDLADQRVA
jgi:hypothetical protein